MLIIRERRIVDWLILTARTDKTFHLIAKGLIRFLLVFLFKLRILLEFGKFVWFIVSMVLFLYFFAGKETSNKFEQLI